LLLPMMIALALGSGLLGIMQSIAGADNALYFYNITNKGVPVGAFANRNHQAILLAMAFPMLAVYASAHVDSKTQSRFRKWIAISSGAVLVPLILVTGSRTGLLVGAIGIIGAAWLYQPPKRKASSRPTGFRTINFRIFAAIAGVVALGGLTLLMSRAAAIQRFVTADELSESRSGFWNVGLQLFWDNLPLGSGPGSFAKIYASAEPAALLDSTYLNHAHNDLLELAISYGLPGLAMLAIIAALALVFFGKLLQTKGQPGWTFRTLGFLLLFIAAIGSAIDYPLRTPLIASLMVIALYWCFPVRSHISKNRPPVPKRVE
jgi:O-antigen ligase